MHGKTQRRALICAGVLLVAAAACVAGAQRRQSPGSLSGIVLGPRDAPVAHARVLIQGSEGRSPRAIQADRQGRFRVAPLLAGLYEIRAQHKGLWSEWRHNVLVRPGRETSVTLRLLPGEPPAGPMAIVLAGEVREWTVPVENSAPYGVLADPHGNVWVTLERANQLGRLRPPTSEWKFFTAPSAGGAPRALIADAQGRVWFVEPGVKKIARLDPASNEFAEFAVPAEPHAPLFGPDGSLWFAAPATNRIYRLDAQRAKTFDFLVPTPNARPDNLTLGPDQALWFTEAGAGKLGRLNPKDGEVSEFRIPFEGARPQRLVAVGAALYYTDAGRGSLGRLDLVKMSFREWPSPSGRASQPDVLAADSEGKLWYIEATANQLVRFDPRTEGFTRFTLPAPNAQVRQMVRDHQGRIWMTLSGANRIAVIE